MFGFNPVPLEILQLIKEIVSRSDIQKIELNWKQHPDMYTHKLWPILTITKEIK